MACNRLEWPRSTAGTTGAAKGAWCIAGNSMSPVMASALASAFRRLTFLAPGIS